MKKMNAQKTLDHLVRVNPTTRRWPLRQMTAGNCSTRSKPKWVSSQLTHGMTGAPVAFRIIERTPNGVVHSISVQARAIRRKYRLVVRDEFADKN